MDLEGISWNLKVLPEICEQATPTSSSCTVLIICHEAEPLEAPGDYSMGSGGVTGAVVSW